MFIASNPYLMFIIPHSFVLYSALLFWYLTRMSFLHFKAMHIHKRPEQCLSLPENFFIHFCFFAGIFKSLIYSLMLSFSRSVDNIVDKWDSFIHLYTKIYKIRPSCKSAFTKNLPCFCMFIRKHFIFILQRRLL